MPEDNLAGRVALVTGASRGIGRAIALALAERGMRILLSGRDSASLAETATAAGDRQKRGPSGGEVGVYAADLEEPDTAAKLVGAVEERWQALDVLVNNAGVTLGRSVEETTVEEWDRVMAVNARAPFLLCRESLRLLRESNMATIINISSVVGRIGYELQGAYSASKHALMGFTKALAREVSGEGIRVHAVAPGATATEMISSVRPDIDQAELIAPEEIADVVAYLLSHRGNATIDEVNIRRATSTPFQ